MAQGAAVATDAYEQLISDVIKDLIFTRSMRGLGNVKPGHMPNLYRLVGKPGDAPEEVLSRVADAIRHICGPLAEYDGLTEPLNTCHLRLPTNLERPTGSERVKYYAAGHVAAARLLLEAWRLRPPSAELITEIRENLVGVDGEHDLTERRTGSLRETYENRLLRDIAKTLVDRHAPDQGATRKNAKPARKQTRPHQSFAALVEPDRGQDVVGDPLDALVQQLDRFVDTVPRRPTCSLTAFWGGDTAPVFELAAMLRPLLAWSAVARTVDRVGIGGLYRLCATIPDEARAEVPSDGLITGYVCGRWILWNDDSYMRQLPPETWLPHETMLHELFDDVEESDPRVTWFCEQLRDKLWVGHGGVLLKYAHIIEWCIRHCAWTPPWLGHPHTDTPDGCVLHTAQFNAKVIGQFLSLVKLRAVELDELPDRCSPLTSVADLLYTRIQEGWGKWGI